MKKLPICSLVAIATVIPMMGITAPPSEKTATSRNGMVTAAHPLAVQAGLDIIAAGGNAIDAAAATAFALAVVEPFGSGIGGDGIALVYNASSGEIIAYEYRCAAPLMTSYDTHDYTTTSQWRGTIAGAATPGMVAGTTSIHADFGSLPLAQVMEPAIRYAEEGYIVGPTLSEIAMNMYDTIIANDDLARTFLVDEFPPEPGTKLTNTDLAASLRLIAEEGPSAFYGGEVGRKLVAGIEEAGGFVRLEDLKSYRVNRGRPLHITYRNHHVYSAPLPYGGMAMLHNLQLIEQLPIDTSEAHTSPVNVTFLANAMKLASHDRGEVAGDPRFVNVNTDWFLSKDFARQRAALIHEDRVLLRETMADFPDEPPTDIHGSTTHLSVMDGDGSAVAITQTLGAFFGCGVLVPGTGIVMNDQMKNFSRLRTSPNNLQPGKRMNSTMAPTIVLNEDREPVMVVGSPGNYRIITTVVQMIVNVIDFNMSLPEAIDAPRITARHWNSLVELEGRHPAETVSHLRRSEFQVTTRGDFDLFFGGVHAIVRDPETGMLTGAADRRRDGVAGGVPDMEPAVVGDESIEKVED
ncbi:MAG: gamma-glutamyltransferase [Candidatus Sumerlaeia bacterium]|nr:gamma-glutamyltransferase [Candidatus Sumerlaeia bacterium]